jgi:predicted DNA-binding antitoxin AbrB/MazE fold protein
MAQVTEAIYAHGVLTPKDQLALREAQRVALLSRQSTMTPTVQTGPRP